MHGLSGGSFNNTILYRGAKVSGGDIKFSSDSRIVSSSGDSIAVHASFFSLYIFFRLKLIKSLVCLIRIMKK